MWVVTFCAVTFPNRIVDLAFLKFDLFLGMAGVTQFGLLFCEYQFVGYSMR